MTSATDYSRLGQLLRRWNEGTISSLGLGKALVEACAALRHVSPVEVASHLQRSAAGRKFDSVDQLIRLAAGGLTRHWGVPDDPAVDALDEPDGPFEEVRGPRAKEISFAHPAFHVSSGTRSGVQVLDLELERDFDIRTLVSVSRLLPQQKEDLQRLLSLRIFGGLTLEQVADRDRKPIEDVRRAWESMLPLLWSASLPEPRSTNRRVSLVSLGFADEALLRTLCKHPELLRSLDSRSFERVIAEVLAQLGFEIELRRGTKDGGVDVIAVRKDSPFGAHRYLVQAKRWSNRVGVAPVRELLFLHDYHRATKSCLATTSTFTSGAWRLGREYSWKLELRDHERLLAWIRLAAGAV